MDVTCVYTVSIVLYCIMFGFGWSSLFEKVPSLRSACFGCVAWLPETATSTCGVHSLRPSVRGETILRSSKHHAIWIDASKAEEPRQPELIWILTALIYRSSSRHMAEPADNSAVLSQCQGTECLVCCADEFRSFQSKRKAHVLENHRTENGCSHQPVQTSLSPTHGFKMSNPWKWPYKSSALNFTGNFPPDLSCEMCVRAKGKLGNWWLQFGFSRIRPFKVPFRTSSVSQEKNLENWEMYLSLWTVTCSAPPLARAHGWKLPSQPKDSAAIDSQAEIPPKEDFIVPCKRNNTWDKEILKVLG